MEFAAGRTCARAALAKLGVAPGPLAVRSDRTPVWPEGFTGSISHTDGFCAAVAGQRSRFLGIGLDAENVAAVTSDIWPDICTAGEAEWLSALPPEEHQRAAALIFSAKEAFYKCQFAAAGRELEFHDVELDLDRLAPGSGRFEIRVLTDAGRLLDDKPLCLGAFDYSGPFILAGYTMLAP
jgi:4'-phosphopantetheinyl transferase EntD